MPIETNLAAAFLERVRSAKSVLIGSHLNPDGDALGSSLAVSFLLDGMGIKNEVLNHHAAPKNLEFLPGIEKIRTEPSNSDADLAIVVDLDSLERLGKCAPYFQALDQNLIVVDHHVPHEAPGQVRLVRTSAAATCELLTQLFMEIEAEITPEMATLLLAGIVTDTGTFRFPNTTPESLHLSAALLERGGNLAQIADEVYGRVPLNAFLLRSKVLNDLHLACDNRIAWATIPNNVFVETGTTDEDTEGFVNELLSINTVEIAALLRESKPNVTRVSIRSRGHDIGEVARVFGGGGHKNAAGCTLEEGVGPASEKLVVELKKCLESS